MIVTLAGHVDHGKSALVHALTGTKTDRLAEEKRRGLTLDLGFAYTDAGDHRLGFVDVPGHHRFIHNMVAGVATDQFALLVVAADDGVMPQTREHLDILRTLALTRGCIALTKIDLVEPGRVEEVEAELEALTDNTFLEAAPIFPCTALNADTLDKLRQHLHAAAGQPTKSTSEPFRLAVDRSFTLSGAGCVVTGTVHGGEVKVGDSLVLGIAAKPVRVRSIRVQNEAAEVATNGDRAAINIAGIDHQEVERGDWLVAADAHNTSRNVVIDLQLLHNTGVKNWGRVHVHAATSHRVGRIALLGDHTGPTGGDNTTPRLAELVLDESIQAKHGDRIVLRDYARQATLGGGAVVFAGREPTRRRHPEHLARLTCYRTDDAQTALAQLLALGPTELADWRATYLLADAQANAISNRLDALVLATQPELSALKSSYEQCRTDVLAAVTAAPTSSNDELNGPTLKELCAALDRPKALVRAAATELVQKQQLQNLRGRYRLPNLENKLSDTLQQLLDKCSPLIDAEHPASVGDLSKTLNLPLGALTKSLNQIAKARSLVRIGDKRYALPKQMQGWADMTEALAQAAPFTVKQFRDVSGLGRNMSIDVLEFMDSKGYTRRNGDTRSVVGERDRLR